MRRFWKRLDRRHGIAATAAFVIAVAAVAWATRVPPGETPYLKIAGAGFMFNYRVADSYYGYTAQLMKPVKNASMIESTFEDPAGGAPIRIETRLWPDAKQYGVRTPNVRGIRKDRPYEVSVRLLEGIERTPVFERRFTVKSDLDDTVMPAEPLTVGPGYAKNPAAGTQRGG